MVPLSQNARATILHVEDDPTTRKLLQRALRDGESELRLVQAEDGDRARQLLSSREVGPPLIIVVDLGVPGMHGGDFLAALREDPELDGTPVFVLSSSSQASHVESAYGHKVAGYIVKPEAPKEMLRVAELLARYAELVTLPGALTGSEEPRDPP